MEMCKLSTTEMMVVAYLQNCGASSARQINEACGTTEARKILSDLSKSGYTVRSSWETGLNKFGAKVRYKLYWLG